MAIIQRLPHYVILLFCVCCTVLQVPVVCALQHRLWMPHRTLGAEGDSFWRSVHCTVLCWGRGAGRELSLYSTGGGGHTPCFTASSDTNPQGPQLAPGLRKAGLEHPVFYCGPAVLF